MFDKYVHLILKVSIIYSSEETQVCKALSKLVRLLYIACMYTYYSANVTLSIPSNSMKIS